jgi:hypothetical protein
MAQRIALDALLGKRYIDPITGAITCSTMSAAKCAVTAARSLRFQYSQPKTTPPRQLPNNTDATKEAGRPPP